MDLRWGLLGLGTLPEGVSLTGLGICCPELPRDATAAGLILHSSTFPIVPEKSTVPDIGKLHGVSLLLLPADPPLLILPTDLPLPATNGHYCSRCLQRIPLGEPILGSPASDGFVYRFHAACAGR